RRGSSPVRRSAACRRCRARWWSGPNTQRGSPGQRRKGARRWRSSATEGRRHNPPAGPEAAPPGRGGGPSPPRGDPSDEATRQSRNAPDGDPMVVVVVVEVTVVVLPHVQSGLQAVKAPPALDGGQVRLPGGSHCSPGSRVPFPHGGAVVVVVEVVDEDVVDDEVVVEVLVPGFLSEGTQRSARRLHSPRRERRS